MNGIEAALRIAYFDISFDPGDGTRVSSADETARLHKSQAFHALVVESSGESARAFVSAFCDICPPYQRPLLVLLSENSHDLSGADVVLPPMPARQLSLLITPLVRAHQEQQRMAELNNALAEQTRSLQRELEMERRRSEEIDLLKNAIVRNVAHELRTPLLQVKSAVALLAEDTGDNTTLVELAMGATTRLEAVVRNITLLNELINESLEKRDLEAVLLREVVDSAIRNLRRSWEHKSQVERIKVSIPDELPPVLGDKQRLAIAIQLILDNALKFSSKAVEVTCRRHSREVEITIRDFGIGIPRDHVAHIFDSFYQVDSSSTKRYGGMGIGLAIVRFILERHKTRIHVETEVDQGSSFSFRLPIADTH
ncbi:MAG: HAMP domain-containing histidine kinase [Anaerolineae bacterium]|nr:HAMP domain-containing histidine kinase [Anaerolineae bacterium]